MTAYWNRSTVLRSTVPFVPSAPVSTPPGNAEPSAVLIVEQPLTSTAGQYTSAFWASADVGPKTSASTDASDSAAALKDFCMGVTHGEMLASRGGARARGRASCNEGDRDQVQASSMTASYDFTTSC